MIELKLPELGENIDKAEVIRVLISEGDTVQIDQNVLELESDKAAFPLPSTHAGRVAKINVKVGDTVAVGQTLMEIEDTQQGQPKDKEQEQKAESRSKKTETQPRSDGKKAAHEAEAEPQPSRSKQQEGKKVALLARRASEGQTEGQASAPEEEPATEPAKSSRAFVAAGPATRTLARELGVPLEEVGGHGPGGRITREDVKAFVKSNLQPEDEGIGKDEGEGTNDENDEKDLLPSSFPGRITRQRLSPLARTAAERLSLAWRQVPHVTQHELADITELEKSRKFYNDAKKGTRPKITVTVLAIRAALVALKAFPHFNSSLDAKSGELIIKNYHHIGVAVDTEHGLLVPVVRDADRKSLVELAAELAELAVKARDRTLTKQDMEGGTFTISNLGGIGGTAFTPIVNYPEVAILGISQARWQIVADEEKQEKRLLLPLSLSYDHRVINGADAARFLVMVAALLSDPFQLLAES